MEYDDEDNDDDDDDGYHYHEKESKNKINSEDFTNNFSEIKTYDRLIKYDQVASLQDVKGVDLDLMKFANQEEDESFLKFRNRIKNNPDQVIRYVWFYILYHVKISNLKVKTVDLIADKVTYDSTNLIIDSVDDIVKDVSCYNIVYQSF